MERKRVQKFFSTKTKVQQNMKEGADINNIVAKFRNGVSPILDHREPKYLDLSNLGSFHEMQNHVKKAEQTFMSYPSKIRKRFDNKPAKLIEFLSDEKNRTEAEELGLIYKPAVEPTPVIPAPAEESPTEVPKTT